jgi:hypothetical protein
MVHFHFNKLESGVSITKKIINHQMIIQIDRAGKSFN